jgi:hypothetical protein
MATPIIDGAVTVEYFDRINELFAVSCYCQHFFLIHQSGTLFRIKNGTAFRVSPYPARYSLHPHGYLTPPHLQRSLAQALALP